jgi:hypothetical protein
MSARMPATIVESDNNDIGVHEWLERINDGDEVGILASAPLATVCASAVDQLEIAVALEVAGISHAVANERYNRADVFALARTLWSRIPMRPLPAPPATLPRSGDWRDLARGVLYVVPAVMLLAVTNAFDLHLARWVLPLAISWGWGLGQVAAYVGYRVQDASPSREATITARVVVGSAFSTLLVSSAVALCIGGGGTAVAATTALATYMVASAVLLVRSEEQWLAVLLLPGALASIVVLAGSNDSNFSRTLVFFAIGGSFLAVLCRALRRPRFRPAVGSGALDRHDVRSASAHLVHGLICGVAVSLVVIQTGHPSSDDEFGRTLLSVPLLASLGVMEWQLHTFRARMARLTHSLHSIEEFPRLAWQVFLRSFATCVDSVAIPAIGVVIAARIHGGRIPAGALVVQCVLGAVFFADLILGLLDRIDLVLRSWICGLVIGGIALTGHLIFTRADFGDALFAASSAFVAVVLILLLLQTHAVLSSAMNH